MNTSLSIAFLAGLISFLSPCVLPLIPGYISYISGTSFDKINEKKRNLIVVKTADSKKEIGCRVVADQNGRLIKIGKNIIDINFPWYIHSGIIKIVKNSYSSFFQSIANKLFINEELDAPIGSFIKKDEFYVCKTSNKDWINVNTLNELAIAKTLF